MRVYTCTPKPFKGDHTFFSRDSGLTCRSFQTLGITSRAIALAPAQADDEPDLIRAELPQLESAAWWRAHQLDGVVLYAWGAPRYRHIARAIRESGARLYIHMDTSGLLSPLVEWRHFIANDWRYALAQRRDPKAWLRFAVWAAYWHSLGLWRVDGRRAEHLRHGDCIGVPSPIATDRLRRLCRIYGGAPLAEKVQLVPAPVAPWFRFDGGGKDEQIIAVGRWNDFVKRPGLLLETLRIALLKRPSLTAVVVGSGCESLARTVGRWEEQVCRRVRLVGVVKSTELPALYNRARISLCVSLSESSHIASAEALCSGCSIVGPRSPYLPSLSYFVSAESGALAERETPADLAAVILQELDRWDAGQRDPARISGTWTARLSGVKVAAEILKHLELEPRPS